MPGKAAYRALDDDPDLEYEHYLAEKLGMLVCELRERMPNDEFVRWSRYHMRKGQQRQLAEKAAAR